jgi:hypothetical protein
VALRQAVSHGLDDWSELAGIANKQEIQNKKTTSDQQAINKREA